MSSAVTTGAPTVRWVIESLALTSGTARDGSPWRLRFDGALWKAEQFDGAWQARGAHAEYRAVRVLAERAVESAVRGPAFRRSVLG